jgi:hypothetical protein
VLGAFRALAALLPGRNIYDEAMDHAFDALAARIREKLK